MIRSTLPILLLAASSVFAASRQVAITIDDLPRGGDGGPTDLASLEAMTRRLLKPFQDASIPLIAFVNGGRVPELGDAGLTRILNLWLDAGADLGNHSYSHLNINKVPLEEYTADILKGEPLLREVLAHGKKLEYYRHPFLFTGPTADIKAKMQRFLDAHGYRVAPVTFDDSDWEFARLYMKPQYRERVRKEYVPYMESIVAAFERMSVDLAGREFPQILLIHASQMNADLMPELLAMFHRRGYEFITLSQALRDPVYQLPEDYAGQGGFSWIHRWAKTKGVKLAPEPEPADWVEKAFAASR